MFTNLIVSSVLLVNGFVSGTSPTLIVKTQVKDEPPTCVGGKNGVNADLFKAGQEAAKRIVEAYSANKEFSPKDVRLMNALKVACAAAQVQQAADAMLSSKDTTLKTELIEGARDNGAKILTRYNSSDGDVSFGGSDLRDLETFQTVVRAMDCLKTATSPPPQTAARRVIEVFNQSGWGATFSPDDQEKVKACGKQSSTN